MRAMIAVDGSPDSMAAVQLTDRILAAEHDTLLLYYSPPPVYVREVPDARATVAALQSFLANAVMQKAQEHIAAPRSRDVQTLTGSQGAERGILVAADERRADLVAIGARGVGPLRTSALGSVTRYIVHHATIPVLVVRSMATSCVGPLRVLLASDGSPISKHAAEILRSFSWPADAVGQIVTVLEPHAHGHLPSWLVEQLDDQQLAALGLGRFKRNEKDEARIRQQISSWCGTLPPIFDCSKVKVFLGIAAEEILQASHTHQIDLIVLGARKHGTVHRALLGSTSEQVLRHASCSVLIVPEHESP